MSLFNDTAQLLAQKTLDLRTERHKLLSSNVANLDPPGYQAEDLVFENSLVAAREAETPGPLKVTDERHLDGNDAPLLDTVEGQRIRSATPFADFDGNTVDLDKEMAKMAENQLMYHASIRMLSHQFRMLKTAISETK